MSAAVHAAGARAPGAVSVGSCAQCPRVYRVCCQPCSPSCWRSWLDCCWEQAESGPWSLEPPPLAGNLLCVQQQDDVAGWPWEAFGPRPWRPSSAEAAGTAPQAPVSRRRGTAVTKAPPKASSTQAAAEPAEGPSGVQDTTTAAPTQRPRRLTKRSKTAAAPAMDLPAAPAAEAEEKAEPWEGVLPAAAPVQAEPSTGVVKAAGFGSLADDLDQNMPAPAAAAPQEPLAAAAAPAKAVPSLMEAMGLLDDDLDLDMPPPAAPAAVAAAPQEPPAAAAAAQQVHAPPSLPVAPEQATMRLPAPQQQQQRKLTMRERAKLLGL